MSINEKLINRFLRWMESVRVSLLVIKVMSVTISTVVSIIDGGIQLLGQIGILIVDGLSP